MFIFLICSERSGSNLLTHIMGAHSSICAPAPSHLFRIFVSNRANYGDLEIDQNWQHLVADLAANFAAQLGEWNTRVDEEQLVCNVRERSLRALLREIYLAEARQQGAEHVFVKENQAYRLVPYLQDAFEGSKFVFMVRDPRDVAASWVATPAVPGGVGEAVQIWVEDQQGALEHYPVMRDSGRMLLLRYEDLLADPHQTLSKLTDFLGLTFEEAMLHFHEREETRRNASRIAAWGNLQRPIMMDNFGKFRDRLTDADGQYVELVTGKLMHFFGYRLEYSGKAGDASDPALLERLRKELTGGVGAEQRSAEREIRRTRLDALNRVLARQPVEACDGES